MKLHKVIFLLLAALISQSAYSANDCDTLRTTKKIIFQTSLGSTAYWKLTKSPILSEPFQTRSQVYADYLSWVKSHPKWSALKNLENHVQVIEKAIADFGTPNASNEELIGQLSRGIKFVKRIISGEIGHIRSLNCQEGIVFTEFLEKVDLRQRSLEFNVSILEKQNELILIGDFYDDPSENPISGASESSAAASFRAKLQSQGWKLTTHHHNHPFDYSNPTGDYGGNTAPSGADLRLYKQLGLQEAVISTGIDTLFLNQEDLRKITH